MGIVNWGVQMLRVITIKRVNMITRYDSDIHLGLGSLVSDWECLCLLVGIVKR